MDRIKKRIKKALPTVGLIALTLVLSVIVNSYIREIQVKVHQGIAWVWNDVNQTAGEFLYDTNGVIFNGKGFDNERDIKHVINESFRSVVQINMIPKETGYVKNLGGTGTGFFVMVDDEYGYIMTNFHVIERALLLPLNIDLKVNTATDWWDYEAEIIGADPVADIALVRIKKKDNEEWKPLEFVEDSRIELTEGDPVVVIGHGMSLPFTASTGHINYTNRFGTGVYTLHLQIDAVVNQGNSGGPVVTHDGKVAGVVVSILSPGRQVPGWDGVGLAVMADIAKRTCKYIMDKYKETGETVKWVPYVEVPYKFKIFSYDEMKDNGMLELDRKDRNMMYVDMEGNEEGQAYKEGLRSGDILLEINGERTRGPLDLLYVAIHSLPGDTITLKVKRGDEFTGYEELEFSFELNEKDEKELREFVNKMKQR